MAISWRVATRFERVLRRSEHPWRRAVAGCPYDRFGLSDESAADRHAEHGGSELRANRCPGVRPQLARRSWTDPQQTAADAHGRSIRTARNRNRRRSLERPPGVA